MCYRKDNVNIPRKGRRCNVADQPRTVCIESWGRAGRTGGRPEGRRGRIWKPLLAGDRGYEWTGEEESDTDGLIIEGGRSIWSRRVVLRELRSANQRRQITPALCANHSLLTRGHVGYQLQQLLLHETDFTIWIGITTKKPIGTDAWLT